MSCFSTEMNSASAARQSGCPSMRSTRWQILAGIAAAVSVVVFPAVRLPVRLCFLSAVPALAIPPLSPCREM